MLSMAMLIPYVTATRLIPIKLCKFWISDGVFLPFTLLRVQALFLMRKGDNLNETALISPNWYN